MNEQRAVISTPIGRLLLVGDANNLRQVLFESQIPDDQDHRTKLPKTGPIAWAAAQLEAYFRQELQAFELPLSPKGTDFQRRVWTELQRIPHGKTVSYSDIATRIHSPKAVRAVGAANGRNPIPIIIPCHRVIGSNGSLTGFGGGLEVKRQLLDLERTI